MLESAAVGVVGAVTLDGEAWLVEDTLSQSRLWRRRVLGDFEELAGVHSAESARVRTSR